MHINLFELGFVMIAFGIGLVCSAVAIWILKDADRRDRQ